MLLASTSNFFPCQVWFDWVDKCYIVTDKRLNGWIRKEATTGMCVFVLWWGTSTNYTSKCYMGKESGSIESKVDFTVASKGDWLLLLLWLFPMRMFQITVFHSRQGEVNFGNLGIPRFAKLIDFTHQNILKFYIIPCLWFIYPSEISGNNQALHLICRLRLCTHALFRFHHVKDGKFLPGKAYQRKQNLFSCLFF